MGFIIKDPEWLGINGTYLLEDVTDNKKHFGVQLVPFAKRIIPGSTYYRSYSGEPVCHKKLEKIYNHMM